MEWIYIWISSHLDGLAVPHRKVYWNWSIRNINRFAANSFFLSCADSLICRKYIKKKSTGDSSGLPFICGFLSCSLWLCYARVTNESSIWLVNIIGSALFFLYSLVYYVFTVNKSALLKQFSVALMILMLCIGYIHSQDDVWNAKEAVGTGYASTA